MTTEEFDKVHAFFTKIHDGNIEGVGVFIDYEEIAPFNNEKGESAAAVALKSKQLAVYEALISRGWCLNSTEDFNVIVNGLEKILKTEVREIIEKFTQNPDELSSLVDNFLDRNRYMLPHEGKSELATIYKSLISEGKKNVNKIAKRFDFALKSELRLIHKRHFIKNPNEEHLTSLITRTNIYFGGSPATRSRPKYLNLIAGAYEELNELQEVRAIFKVVANIRNLKIIFDFDRDTIDHADATGNCYVNGKSYADTGDVYLGARALIKTNRDQEANQFEHQQAASISNEMNTTRSEALGVLAHELCHIAIFRIYNNDYKPYHKEDLESEKEFESVLCDCERKLGKEAYIDVVINGPELIMHEELCVRVPHLLALYQGNNEKVKFLKETFKSLFDFYEKKTLRDLEMEVELMSAVWKLKSKEPQHLTDSKIMIRPRTIGLDLDSKRVMEISSNCPQMTLNLIFHETTCKSNLNFLFLVLNDLKVKETWDLMLDAHSSCMKPTIIISCDNEIEKEIAKIAEEMKEDKIDERIILIHNHKKPLIKDATFLEISHSWSDLVEESKENLIKKMISFQGEKLLLDDVVDRRCDALDFVSLKNLLENYLKIGNELEFPEIDIHVTRKFRNNKSEEINSSQLINIAVKTKFILLSDDPGMGKTTELKMLAMEFKKKFKSFWVAFVDLKEHSEFYEKDESFKTDFNSADEIGNFFATKIFKLNEFEEKVFKYLFCCESVVFLLDGFDEISPSFKKFVKMLINSISKHSGNILVTSTRPHLKDELCRELNIEAFNLLPLTEEYCVEILELSFEKKGITGHDLVKKIDETIEFLKKLNKNSDPVRNPLILRMVAKVFTDDKVAQVTQANISSIYENFIKMMIMDSMVKGEDAKQEAANRLTSEVNIIPFYRREAIKALFGFDDKLRNMNEFLNLCFKDVHSLSDEQVTRIALMKSDGSGKFQFIHRTFAEFFAADFLYKNVFVLKSLKEREQEVPITKKRLKAIYEIFREVFENSFRYELVRSFIDGALENSMANIEMIEKRVLISTFHDIFTRYSLPLYFFNCVFNKLLSMITVITRSAGQQELKRMWTHKNCNGDNIFMFAALKGSLYFNQKLTALGRKILDENDFLNIFTERNEEGGSVISCAFKNNNPEVFDFYLKREFIPMLFDQVSDDFELKVKLIKLLRRNDISGFQNELEKIKEDCGLEHLQHFLNSWTIEGRTFYHLACYRLSSIEEFQNLWELLTNILDENDFKTLLKKPTRDGKTTLMTKAQKCKKELFITFWRLLTEDSTDEEKEKFLIEENGLGDNLFECATWNENPETFLAIKELYVEIFGRDKMRIMLTRERKIISSILYVSVRVDWDNTQTVKALWTFIQEIFDISTQKTILMKSDWTRKSVYGRLLSRPDFNELMKIFEPFIEQHLTALEIDQFKYGDKGWLRNYFTSKNENGESIISLAFKQNKWEPSPNDQLSDTERYTLVESYILRFLEKEDIAALRSELEKIKAISVALKCFQHFLITWRSDGETFYLKTCYRFSSLDDFVKLWNLLQIILSKNDLKVLLNKSTRGTTPLMRKAQLCEKEVFISFWRLLTEGLTEKEKEKLLMEKDGAGDNTFDCATLNADHETFLTIKDLYLSILRKDKMRIMMTRERWNGGSILFLSIEFYFNNLATIQALWTFIQEICDVTTQKAILMKESKNGNTFYGRLMDIRDFTEIIKIFEQFIEQHLTSVEKEKFISGTKGWLRIFLTEKNENGESVVSLLNNSNDLSPYDQFSDEELYSKIESQIFQFLKSEDISTLRSELEKIKEIAIGVECLKSFLNSPTIDGATIYLDICRHMSSIEDYEKLWKLLRRILCKSDFKTLIRKPNSHGTTPLMWKSQLSKKEVFISFWRLLTEDLTDDEKEKFLVEEDGDGDNTFDCASLNLDHETFLTVKDLYLKTFGENKMRIMMTRERKSCESILYVSVRIDLDNTPTVEAIWLFIQEIFDVSIQKTILMKTDENGKAFYMRLAGRHDFDEIMKILEPFIEENLTALEKEQFKYISEHNKVIRSYMISQKVAEDERIEFYDDEENTNQDIEDTNLVDNKRRGWLLKFFHSFFICVRQCCHKENS